MSYNHLYVKHLEHMFVYMYRRTCVGVDFCLYCFDMHGCLWLAEFLHSSTSSDALNVANVSISIAVAVAVSCSYNSFRFSDYKFGTESCKMLSSIQIAQITPQPICRPADHSYLVIHLTILPSRYPSLKLLSS